MKKSYKERQEEWVKENNISKGDRVRVTRKAKASENGWENDWADEMDTWVEEEGVILGINSVSGIIVQNADKSECWYFPYFVLEKVEPKEKEMKKFYGKRQAEWVKKNNIEVGDTVRVIRKANDEEDGWRAMWATEMDDIVGEAGVVIGFVGDAGVRVRFYEKFSWSLPYFILEKVMKNKDKEWTISYGLKIKTGDPVLVRDSGEGTWRFSYFSDVLAEGDIVRRYRTAGLTYTECIPYVGNEHLVGTKMDYKAPEEPTKPKFIFGAKVKATLSCGEEIEGVLIGFDTEDDDTTFEVVVRDEDASFDYTTYRVKSVTYID